MGSPPEDHVQADLPAVDVVICELVWALRKTYGQPRGVIASSLAALVNTPQLALESVETVEAAIAHGSGDIADSIIHLIGRSAGCMTTVTFDRKFARLPGVELLA